jgi:clan AA aspartic protease (TIGR02281 family)
MKDFPRADNKRQWYGTHHSRPNLFVDGVVWNERGRTWYEERIHDSNHHGNTAYGNITSYTVQDCGPATPLPRRSPVIASAPTPNPEPRGPIVPPNAHGEAAPRDETVPFKPPSVQPRVPAPSHDSVPITTFANGEGVLIPVGVGKYTITMMLDTGASSMMLSNDVADALVRDGSAYSIGTRRFRMADGRVVEEPMIVVNEVRIGNHILHNVEASVMPGNDMLLGFSVVNQIGPFTINTRTNELVFGS